MWSGRTQAQHPFYSMSVGAPVQLASLAFFDGDPQAWRGLGSHCKETEPGEQGQQYAFSRRNTPGRLTGVCQEVLWASSKATRWPSSQSWEGPVIVGRPASERRRYVPM